MLPNVDTTGDGQADEGSLRGSSEIVANRIREEIQSRVEDAGLEILEERIPYWLMLQKLLPLCFSANKHLPLLMHGR